MSAGHQISTPKSTRRSSSVGHGYSSSLKVIRIDTANLKDAEIPLDELNA
jgi:hypothetical protein